MNLKSIVALVGTVGLFALGTWGVAQSQAPSLPDGVSEENWIPISDSIGIAVTDVRAGRTATRAVPPDDPSDPTQLPTIIQLPPKLYGKGVVFAKFQGEWVMFEELAVTDPRFRHLK